MAAVTLKDLMDPLTKIQAATEATAEGLGNLASVLDQTNKTQQDSSQATANSIDALAGSVAASGQVGDGIQEAILQELKLQTQLLKKRQGGGIANLFGGKGGGKSKGMAAGGNAFKMLGAGTIEMAKGLLLFMLVPKKTVTKFNDFVRNQIEMWGESDPKKMEKGAAAMEAMGSSILTFSKALALSALLLIPAALGIPLLYLATAMIVPLFLLLGMGEKQIKKGAESMEMMGKGMKSFAIGLALFALTTFFILMQPTILIGMVASLVLMGGAIALLGMADKQIRKGSVALVMMGIGLAVFGLGYAAFAGLMMAVSPTIESIFIQVGVLLGIGIATAILGALFANIVKGAISLAAMGVGLLIFGLGYIPFSHATKDTTMEDVGVQGALLLMLGLEFAAAGFGAMFIIPGALAFAAIGGALLLLAPGLTAIKKVSFDEQDAKDLTTTLAGVKLAFVGPPKGGGVSGFFKSIAGAISGGADAVAMVSAAAGFAAAGMALSKLSVGLKAYQKLDWTSEESVQLAEVLSGITTAFAQAGGEAATPTGLFGKVFGNAFSPNATKKGIDSVMGAGKALTSIAVGLTEFQKLVDSKVDFNVLGIAIEDTVGFVQRAFAAVADEGQVAAGGFFGTLFGIKKNKVAEGLDAVQGAGSALTGIANGLTGFQKLIDSKVDFGDPADPKPGTLAYAVINTVGFVQKAFSAIGSQKDVDKGGFFGGLFGIKQNAVKKGIESVQGAGDELSKIATAISTFSGIEDPEAVAEKIKLTLGLVGDAFASIGGKENEDSDSSFFGLINWDENKIQKGIEAVDGAGAALTDIAKGLKAFSGDFQPEAVATSVGTLLTSIGTAFSDLYTANPNTSMQLDDFATFVVTIGDVAEKGQLEKAAEGISKMADAVNKIEIDKAVAFGDLFKSSSKLTSERGAYKALAKAVEDIRDMMEDQGGGGANVFEKAANFIDGGSRGKSTGGKSTGGSGKDSKALLSALAGVQNALVELPSNIISGMDGIEVKTTGI